MSSQNPILDADVDHLARDSSSKQPDNGPNGNGGFQPQNKMLVQPPTKDDLQRSYARTIDTEASPKGWYGSMSTSPLLSFRVMMRNATL